MPICKYTQIAMQCQPAEPFLVLWVPESCRTMTSSARNCRHHLRVVDLQQDWLRYGKESI